jgi:hypothetical protein
MSDLKKNINKTDNINTNVDINSDIDIIKLINTVDNLSMEKDKDEFIKNYSKAKEQIVFVDKILNSDNYNIQLNDTISDNNNDNDNDNNMTNYLNKLSLNELFEILEKNQHKISNPSKLLVSDLKTLLQVSKILEQRLTNDTMNIIELK